MTTVLRVLVVDDDFMVARIHGRFVEQTDGFEVVGTARTGEEALALTAELRPDLLLLDVHLPDLTGLEVLERLRGRGDDVAVVMVTAERGATAVRAALHGGALQYLVKPFEYDDLADRLRTVAATLASLGGAEVDQAAIDRAFAPPGPAVPAVRAACRRRCRRASAPRRPTWSSPPRAAPARSPRPRPPSSSASPGSRRGATWSTSSTPARPRCACSTAGPDARSVATASRRRLVPASPPTQLEPS
ncbi:response regulator [Pimelobacter simplex]|uniref:response regulator n=1 Tax=Nocardioides simplex TaxID=2045 RepID=UPI001C208815|nr:response regulator [Pimelobacter simplex]